MGISKRDRLDEFLKRFRSLAPFGSYSEARLAMETIMNQVEDEMSGIEANPDAATSPPDGRMYPPHDLHQVKSTCAALRTFKMAGHRTAIGENGAVKITLGTGEVELDIAGDDGRTIDNLLLEKKNERSRGDV